MSTVSARTGARHGGHSAAQMREMRSGLKSLRWGRPASVTPAAPINLKRIHSADFQPIPGTTPVSIADHREGQCRWPVGERPILFCGASCTGNYCDHHQELSLLRPDSPVTVPLMDLRKLERTVDV